jgi:hypothetical protein
MTDRLAASAMSSPHPRELAPDLPQHRPLVPLRCGGPRIGRMRPAVEQEQLLAVACMMYCDPHARA